MDEKEQELEYGEAFREHQGRIILEQSESCEDVEFIMRALELDRCPYCLAYYNEQEILIHEGRRH